MRSPAFALIPLLLFGCAQDQRTQSVPAATMAGGERVACIDVGRVAGRRAENNRTIVFELAGGQTYRNDLQETCPGIQRASSFGSLSIDPIESRLCSGDMVRVYDPAEIRGSSIKAAPRCRLGAFTRIANR